MRILMIIDGLPGGGAERCVITLAQEFVSNHHKVSIFSLRSICDYVIPHGVEYKTIIDHKIKTCPWRKITEIKRRAKALDKEIQISQKHNNIFNLVISNLHKTDRIVACSRVLAKDCVWFCLHTVFSLAYLKNLRGLFRWLKYFRIHFLYHNKNIIAVSNEILEDIKKVFKIKPNREIVIHNPFNFDVIRKHAAFPCDLIGKNYLIHIGRIHKHKRQDRLLHAYAQSGIQDPLLIIGKGDVNILNKLKSLTYQLNINNRVLFKTFDYNPYPYIYHARMLILSSDIEGFGNVLVESLICQTPTVSTCCPGGPTEILKHLLSKGLSNMNAESLAQAMQRVYYYPPEIKLSYINNYKVHYIYKKYINLINKSI